MTPASLSRMQLRKFLALLLRGSLLSGSAAHGVSAHGMA